jgi:hypothetical protein
MPGLQYAQEAEETHSDQGLYVNVVQPHGSYPSFGKNARTIPPGADATSEALPAGRV